MVENKLYLITLLKLTRTLKNLRGLKSKAYLIGGVVTEGYTHRDIDIVVNNLDDIPTIKKCLGSLSRFAHFSYQKGHPPAPIYLVITGKEPTSPPPTGEKKGFPFHYAGPGSK